MPFTQKIFISLKNSEEMLIIVHGVSGNNRSFGQTPLQNITCIVYLILGHPQSKHTKSCEGPEIITKPIT